VTATATTTVRGVSILTAGRRRNRDVFDLDLSSTGMEIRRPGRAPQRMSWERVSQWELEERPDHLLLTLRGDGSVTPLVVRGWTLEDLAAVMREVTAGAPRPPVAPPPAVPRAERRRRRRRRARLSWKPVVTVALLAVLAAAVTLVLLQSAGVISWGFLGPTA